MSKKSSKSNVFSCTLIVPQSNKTTPRVRFGREQLSTLTIPSQGPIVDPSLGTITKAPEEQEDKTFIKFS